MKPERCFTLCKTARRGLRPNFATEKFELWLTCEHCECRSQTWYDLNMILKKLIIPIILILLLIGGYLLYKMDKNKICPAIYNPVTAKNILTRETQTFGNGCKVPFWWKIESTI